MTPEQLIDLAERCEAVRAAILTEPKTMQTADGVVGWFVPDAVMKEIGAILALRSLASQKDKSSG